MGNAFKYVRSKHGLWKAQREQLRQTEILWKACCVPRASPNVLSFPLSRSSVALSASPCNKLPKSRRTQGIEHFNLIDYFNSIENLCSCSTLSLVCFGKFYKIQQQEGVMSEWQGRQIANLGPIKIKEYRNKKKDGNSQQITGRSHFLITIQQVAYAPLSTLSHGSIWCYTLKLNMK